METSGVLFQGKFFIMKSILVITSLLGLYGCAPINPPISAPQAQSAPAPCSLEAPDVNIYNAIPRPLTREIFQKAYPNPSNDQTNPNPPSPADPKLARFAAFQDLVRETQRWSDFETIVLGETNVVKITVTFISPELIDAVVLNQVLLNPNFNEGFDSVLLNVRQSFAARGELLFLVTFTATNNTDINLISHSIVIPIRQMVLTNSGNVISPPAHEDHNLELPINSSSEFAFGFIAYPLAGAGSNGCNWLLDPKYNTTIVLSVPLISVDNTNRGSYSWKFSYAPPLAGINPVRTPDYNIPVGFTEDMMTPAMLPPRLTTNLSFPNGGEPEIYWQEFARYIWHQLIGEPY